MIYLSLHCDHRNDSCFKMGSDESHFNILLIVRDKVTRQCPQTTAFEEKGEPKRNRAKALLLTSLRFTARPNRRVKTCSPTCGVAVVRSVSCGHLALCRLSVNRAKQCFFFCRRF